MRFATEEFLNLVFWATDVLGHPTFRNLTDSYESWAYRRGLAPRVALLRRRQFLEADPELRRGRRYRLTERGRLHALGGRDPEAQWSRHWDGRWRVVVFDVPVARNACRARLRRRLRGLGFGYLQDSVWITPDPLGSSGEVWGRELIGAGWLMALEGRPCEGLSDGEIVAAAWDFEVINRRYEFHLRTLADCPGASPKNARQAEELRSWVSCERQAWLAAVAADPLLPERLLPAGYRGRQAWQRRSRCLRAILCQASPFALE